MKRTLEARMLDAEIAYVVDLAMADWPEHDHVLLYRCQRIGKFCEKVMYPPSRIAFVADLTGVW